MLEEYHNGICCSLSDRLENSEHLKMVELVGNVLTGSDSKEYVSATEQIMERKRYWVNPYMNETMG